MQAATQLLDWFSILHLIAGLILGCIYGKGIKWVFFWIFGWELAEHLILPHICCPHLWLEAPINTLGDVIVGFLGYMVGLKSML